MDPLNWILVTWLAMAAFIFFVVQKVIEFWPIDTTTTKTAQQKLQQEQQYHQQTIIGGDKTQYVGASSSIPSVSYPAFGQQQQQQQHQQHQFGRPIESVDWLNEFLSWLFHHYKGSPDFLNSWLKSMNDAAKKVAPLVGCEVLFEEISTEDRRAPQLSQIRTEQGPREHLTLRGKLYSPGFNLRLVTSQKLPDRLVVTNYDAKLTNLTGDAQIRAACIGNELFLMACFDGRPDVTIHLENKDLHGEEQVDHSCVQEAIRKSLMSSVTNLSIRGSHGQSVDSVEDVFRRLNASGSIVQATGQADRFRSNRLLVKVLRAEKLEGAEIPNQPYVVIEMDDPPQKHTTTLGLNACPVWDEHFLFDVNRRSEELLFEVYDKRKENAEEAQFIGLAIVGIEELRQSAITSHALKLQPRPYSNEKAHGVLFVECTFLFESGAGKETEMLREEFDHGVITHTTTTAKRPLVAIGGDARDTERTVNVTPTKTSSVIVKSVSQYIHAPAESTDHVATAQEPLTTTTSSTLPNPPRRSSKENTRPSALKQPPPSSAPATPSSTISRTSVSPKLERGRKPSRPSFFGDLKQKLSFKSGKKPSRAQSLDQGQGLSPTDVTYHPPRSVSTPPSRDNSATRYSELGRGASDSELSTTSNDSIYQQSSLVVETVENNVKKYHLIPPSMTRHPNAKKLMKIGRKLHIYNEHTFVAVKVPSSTTCKVCLKAVSGAFRKQGYQCRGIILCPNPCPEYDPKKFHVNFVDCRMLCHKKCHFKTETKCPNSKVSSLQMYVTNL